MILSTEELKDFILNCLTIKKASNIVCLYTANKTPLADYMIFANGRSVKNIKEIAEHIATQLKKEQQLKVNVEGIKNSDWILLDAGATILHLLHPDARASLQLEQLWD